MNQITQITKLFPFLVLLLNFIVLDCHANELKVVNYDQIKSGALQTEKYFHLIRGKQLAIVTNQTGIISDVHLVDSLINAGMQVKKVFSPEHGFRGNIDAGALIDNHIDSITQLPVISLYGKNKKPLASDLQGIDMVIFDLQDVGVRFYTYISTLTYVMEACNENGIPLIVLDRPNPNGYYIDGPVLDKKLQSFVGLHPVPVVYGLTIGEYALMVQGEKWISEAASLQLTVIPLSGYERTMIAMLPVKPSPNLPNWESIYLYPSLCFFEGTIVSVGRGTEEPFQRYGHPDLPEGNITFTPKPIEGASINPPLKNQQCNGNDLKAFAHSFQYQPKQLQLSWLIDSYNTLKNKHMYFNNYFSTLAGTFELRQQIEAGISEKDIRLSWLAGIQEYKKIRVKYLLYPDPENLF